jgi:putative ABC transport system permease protein
MPDREFSQILPVTQGDLTGILVNSAKFTQDNRRRVELSPYGCEPGVFLPLRVMLPDGGMREVSSLTIGNVADSFPDIGPSALFTASQINVVVPESAYMSLYQKFEDILREKTDTMFWAVTDKPDEFCENAAKSFEQYPIAEGEERSIYNLSQMTRLNRNITLIVMLFGYGFITMLSLIAVTSVIATISTGMALRRQEFAMLYSAGMTPYGMNKMLNLESLLYGAKSLLIGLPVGLALSYMIYLGMSNTFQFPYVPPLNAIFISAAAVMLLTFGTMRYGKRKLDRISIVEAIRNETL